MAANGEAWRSPLGGAVYVHFNTVVRRALPAEVAMRERGIGLKLVIDPSLAFARERRQLAGPE